VVKLRLNGSIICILFAGNKNVAIITKKLPEDLDNRVVGDVDFSKLRALVCKNQT